MSRKSCATSITKGVTAHSVVRAGEMAEVEFTVEVEAAAEPVPTIPPLALMLLAFMLIASGAWLQRRRRAVASF